jgi:ATP-dependent helicase/nuclease subunit B
MTPTLILGWSLDGAPAPIGLPPLTAVTGPLGCLDLLGQWVGLDTRAEPEANRIAACHAAIATEENRFWSKSFTVDSWATARRVLALRDALLLAGWDGTADATAPPRIADLASLPALPRSVADVLREVIALLPERKLPFLPRVALAEPAELWPPLWQRLFAQLDVTSYLPPEAPALGDLAVLRRFLEGGPPAVWVGDGSVTLLTGDAPSAANLLSAWLPGLPPGAALMGGEEGVLSPLLRARHQPRPAALEGADLGAQLLSLGLALLWDPFDAGAALEFLALPQHPLGGACRFLTDAIVQSPGYGGVAYRAARHLALRAKLRVDRAREFDRTTRHAAARARLAAIDAWLPPKRYTAEDGIPASAVTSLCGLVQGWATKRNMPEAGAAAASLAQSVAISGVAVLDDMLLGRMLETAASGAVTLLAAEAAPWRFFARPGARLESVETTIWWLGGAEGQTASPWRMAEQNWMAAHGLVPDEALAPARARAGLHRAVTLTSGRLVVAALRDTAAEGGAHPLLAELQGCFGESLERAWVGAESLQSGGVFAGLTLPSCTVPAAAPPAPRRDWLVPAGLVSPRERESASGMETLLGCKLKWVLQYAARLYARGPASLPEAKQLTGTFLHEVMSQVLTNGYVSPADATNKAQALFERLLPEEAAPLLRPGMQATQARAKGRIGQAMADLTSQIQQAGLQVAATEHAFEKSLPGQAGRLYGRIDLLLHRPADGLRVVLDAKWSASSWYRKKLEQNTAVQLAAYAWLVAGPGAPATAAYYLLRQRRLLAADSYPFPGAAVPGADLMASWQAALADYREALAELRDGRIIAAGVPGDGDEDDGPQLDIPPPCTFCDYQTLCGAGARP